MLRKYRKSLIRISSLISSLVIFLSCIVAPVSAASTTSVSSTSNWIQILDFATINGGIGRSFRIDDALDLDFDLSGSFNIKYFDIVLTSSSQFLISISAGGYEILVADSDFYRVHDNVYRFRVAADFTDTKFSISFVNPGTDPFDVTFLSCRANLCLTNAFLDSGSFTVNNLPLRDFTAGSDTYYYWDSASSPFGDQRYSGFIYLDNASKYDFADVHLMACASSIDSLSCYYDNVGIPFEVSYLASDGDGYVNYVPGESVETARWFDFIIRLDFTDLDFSSSSRPCIELRGLTPYDFTDNFLRVMSYTGYVVASDLNMLQSLFVDLKNFFTDLFEDTFGSGNDSAASDAIQSQEQINVEINNQISDAMDTWSENIDSVSGNAELAVSNTQTALGFLSNYAQRIFNGIGWFGTVYFFICFVSIYFLIMSKSGLGRAINHLPSDSK